MITPENHWKESPKKSGTKPESMNVKSAAITSFIVIQSVWNLGSIFHGIRTKGEIGIVREWWIFIERQTFFPVEQQQQQATASMRLIYTETREKKTNHKISMENSTTSDVAVLGDCLDGFCLFGVVYSVQSVYIILFSVHYINETFDRQKTENALEMMLIKIQRQKVLFGLLLLLWFFFRFVVATIETGQRSLMNQAAIEIK